MTTHKKCNCSHINKLKQEKKSPKISVIGAGHVGSTTAFLLVQKQLGNVVLLDVVDGLSEGKALDIAQCSYNEQCEPNIIGTCNYQDTANSDIIIITAGLARKPGMTRQDLLVKNLSIIKEVVESCIAYSSNPIIIMMTNPVDILTAYVHHITNLPKNRIIGQGGLLDTSRYTYFLGTHLGITPSLLNGLVIGEHNINMIPLHKHTTYKNQAITELIPHKILNELTEKTRKGGAQIVSYLKTGSAYYAPGSALCAMTEYCIKGNDRLVSSSVMLEGQYGIKNVCLGVPVKLSSEGLQEIIELELSSSEQKQLEDSAQRCQNMYKEFF